MWSKSIIIVSILWIIADGARILVILPEPSYSHQVAFRPITMELARRGHELVIFTPTPINDPTLQNYIEVKLDYCSYKIDKSLDVLGLAKLGAWPILDDFYRRNEEMTDGVLSNPAMQQLISPNSTAKFDLIIVEYLFYDALYALAYRFNAPLIGITSIPIMAHHYHAFGNPILWSYVPDLLANTLDENMNLLDRFVNAYYYIRQIYWYQYYIIPLQEKMVRKHFGDNMPPAHELVSKMDLLLANFHPFLYPHAHVPAIIPIRGSRPINRNNHTLPEDLQKILDNPKGGCVIYFSLGSNIKGTFISAERLEMFMKTFENINCTILFKFESNLANQPSNVIIREWYPQHEILAHPNVRLFIYQGGLQSTEEAIENGVPVIGFPVLADQHYNVKQLENYGTGKRLIITDVTKNELEENINEILTNCSYKNNMLKLRALLRDLPYKPLNNIIWWIEHMIRHNGAPHLRNKSRDMPWYKTQLLDMLAIVFVSVVLIMYIVIVITRCIFRIVMLTWKKAMSRTKYNNDDKKQQ
ncbi:UDP-glycosyltransferase UGT5-like isoform X2 [Cataglyphis hispanica]|uniref:UDP-glycosyltransferase UGT5-like isoform X2 n=1 Tax=Cataglyphis hispanica TaxID=1086592 RepID=UPI0021805CB6|nr:UDP-glycosyltransferase UGT5-like isoform X2 [Cataglyphis hispanica]